MQAVAETPSYTGAILAPTGKNSVDESPPRTTTERMSKRNGECKPTHNKRSIRKHRWEGIGDDK